MLLTVAIIIRVVLLSPYLCILAILPFITVSHAAYMLTEDTKTYT